MNYDNYTEAWLNRRSERVIGNYNVRTGIPHLLHACTTSASHTLKWPAFKSRTFYLNNSIPEGLKHDYASAASGSMQIRSIMLWQASHTVFYCKKAPTASVGACPSWKGASPTYALCVLIGSEMLGGLAIGFKYNLVHIREVGLIHCDQEWLETHTF